MKFFSKKTTLYILLCTACILCACSKESVAYSPITGPEGEAVQTDYASGEGKAVISEVMSKNKATLMADDGSFPDWVEIQNLTGEVLDIENWQISDDAVYDSGMVLKGSIQPNGYAAFFVTGFGLSEGDTVFLFDGNGQIIDTLDITNDTSDYSNTKEGQTKYPTPGKENTKEAYALWQSEQQTSGPLVINEVMVENFEYLYTTDDIEYTDWVEIKNISGEVVNLSDYYISDDADNLKQYNLPNEILEPGQLTVILCDKKADTYAGQYHMASFSLDSTNDRLYISNAEGTVIDYAAINDVPYGGSYGRMNGENGFFYFSEPSPGENNTDGKRYVAETPVSGTKDGIYNGVESVEISLEGEGDIYYTTDGTIPTTDSTKYTEPFSVSETTIVRAICAQENALDSRALTMSFIINENHTLPVVSVVSDDKDRFRFLFKNGYKADETPGVISYYDENGSFTIGAGIKLHGDTSLVLAKKNLSFRFRGCYGQEELSYDIYGEGRSTFTNLLLRAGQEQNDTIVRGEACINLLSEYSDSVIYQRGRYCVVYVDGEYNGIYSLKEKMNEQLYADISGVSKDSVIMNEATVYGDELFYSEVISPIYYTDMSNDLAFEEATKYLDLDSFIDWILLEGWTGNYDLASGNLRYVKSDEADGKWKLCCYDLDVAFVGTSAIYTYVYNYPNQIGALNKNLLENDAFRDRFLKRAAEVYSTYLTDENIIAQLDMLADEIRPELARDGEISFLGEKSFETHLNTLKTRIIEDNWTHSTINAICDLLGLTKDERMQYFNS